MLFYRWLTYALYFMLTELTHAFHGEIKTSVLIKAVSRKYTITVDSDNLAI